jgi:hypothetical protein
MNNLARLVEVASNVLRVPEKTVRSRVMLLRKNSLWSSIGKGISADPAPSDASNLLLSFLGGGLVTETAETVRLLRNCLYVAPSKNAAPPPISLFAEFGRKHMLGDMLDALFAQWSERGPPVSLDNNLPFTCVTLAIERYSRSWEVELFLRRDTKENWGEERWFVEYEFFPELLAASNQKQLARAAQRMAEKRGDLVTSARVSERTFTALADCLSRPTHRAIPATRFGNRIS